MVHSSYPAQQNVISGLWKRAFDFLYLDVKNKTKTVADIKINDTCLCFIRGKKKIAMIPTIPFHSFSLLLHYVDSCHVVRISFLFVTHSKG